MRWRGFRGLKYNIIIAMGSVTDLLKPTIDYLIKKVRKLEL